MSQQYKIYTDAIEEFLDAALPQTDMPQRKLLDAMRYSLLDGGKRLRPVILLDFCRMCGGEWKDALPFACALEMVHTYSLIHDDLPCMDNDETRRGKPANHIRFGEATALLAGSALLSAAFETMLRPHPNLKRKRAMNAAYIIARASGLHGIAGGQELDLHRNLSIDLTEIHSRKTAAMFIAAASAGCNLAGADRRQVESAIRFGRAFGMGFQYADDFADKEAESCERAQRYYLEALTYLKGFEHTDFLDELITKMIAKLTDGGR